MAAKDKPPPPTDPTPREILPVDTRKSAAEEPTTWQTVPPPPKAEWTRILRPGERQEEAEEAAQVAAAKTLAHLVSKGAVQAEPARSETSSSSPSSTSEDATADLELPSLQMGGEAVVGGTAAAEEAVVRRSDLVADPDYRISLSDPRVEKQHTESQA